MKKGDKVKLIPEALYLEATVLNTPTRSDGLVTLRFDGYMPDLVARVPFDQLKVVNSQPDRGNVQRGKKLGK